MRNPARTTPRRSSGGVFFWALAAVPALLLCACSKTGGINIPPYIPPVTLTGLLNGTEFTLKGNNDYRNRCFMDNDTLQIKLYSEDYQPGFPATGRFMDLAIYPPRPKDSLATRIDQERTRLDFVDHEAMGTCTWVINPKYDSAGTTNTASLTIGSEGNSGGQAVLFTDVTFQAQNINVGGCPLGGLWLTKGRIEGHVQ